MSADLNLFVDIARQTLVQGPFSLQPLVSLPLTQAENINVAAQMLDLTGNGLQPYVNIDPTGWSLQFAVGYIDDTGTKQLIALSATTAVTSISGISAQTALAFVLNLATTAAATLLDAIHSAPVWCEVSWNPNTANTAYVNKAQVPGEIETGYIGVGLPAPV